VNSRSDHGHEDSTINTVVDYYYLLLLIDAPAACATLSATRPFRFVHTARVLQREREMLASTCLYSLYA